MADEPKFTPGPWRIASEREDELKVKGPEDEWVADCADGFWSDETDGWIMAADSEANARLIAAAPELLAACEAQEAAHDARANCECEGEGQWEHCGSCSERFGQAIDLRRAAIAKALNQ